MHITIDGNSGFCFGVVYAIELAEKELAKNNLLYCLGDIVHNNMEVKRLKDKGLIIIDHIELEKLHNCTILIRAHGEPPETYRLALENNLTLIDASCPVVLMLQNNIRKGFNRTKNNRGQIVIYGKEGHAEVNGLVGQTLNNAIIINNEKELNKINFNLPIILYSQTTKSRDEFYHIVSLIKEELNKRFPLEKQDFIINDTTCRQVSQRDIELKEFAANHKIIIFVSGKKSSNGIALYNACKSINPNTYLISEVSELKKQWFLNFNDIGICGATSTPMWLMEEISQSINRIVEAN